MNITINNKFDKLKDISQTIYNDIFKLIYISDYENLNKLYDKIKNNIKEIEEDENLILTNNYNLLKEVLINIFELKNPMVNLDLLHLIIKN